MIRQRMARRADLIEDIASAYGGCQSKDGLQAMAQRITQLTSID